MTDQPSRQPTVHPTALDQPQQPVADLIAGRYEVVHKLAGGMGLVYLCRDYQTKQLVALKTFKPEYLSHRAARDLFLREGTMWVELGIHTHIVRAFRVERIGDGREVYLVLEWVVQPQGLDGPSLRSWLKPGRPLPVKTAVTFALHIARGMKYATEKIRGLVHRDLKPENVLIGYDGNARVTDFGLASTLTGMSREVVTLPQTKENYLRTQLTQDAVGTPLYMAPEQWTSKSVDARADIYALGCILYEMIAGQFAVDAEEKDDIREVHLSGRIKPPPPDTPRELILFLRKCLMVNREQRYRDWGMVELALVEVYRRTFAEEPPSEKAISVESREVRLAAGYSYNSMGLSYLDIGKLDVAVMYFEQAVWVGRAEHSLELEGVGLGNLGRAYTALGNLEWAVEFYDEHLAIARQLRQRAEEGVALGNLGQAYRRLGDAQRAVRFHERELAISQELSDRYKEAAALDNLGDSYRQLGNTVQAVHFYQQSLAIARDIGDMARVKSILRSMGRIYLDSNEVKEAVTLFQQAYDIAHKIGDRMGEGEVLGDLGMLYHKQKYPQKAIEFYERALKIAQESNDRRRMVRTLSSLGDIHFELEDVAEAKEYYEATLTAVNNSRDVAIERRVLGKLGNVYSVMQDYTQAASLHKRELALAQELKDRVAEQQALVNLGRAFERWGDLGRAVEYFEQHLTLSRQINNRKGEMGMLRTLGGLYHKLKQFRLAEKAYNDSLTIARETGNRGVEGDVLNRLGDVFFDKGDVRQALDVYYKDALKIAQDRKDLVAEASTTGNMGLAYNHLDGTVSNLTNKWQAVRQCEKALTLAQKSGDENSIAWANYKLAAVLVSQERWSKAQPNAQMAEELFGRLGNGEMVDTIRKMLSEIEQNKKKGTSLFS